MSVAKDMTCFFERVLEDVSYTPGMYCTRES